MKSGVDGFPALQFNDIPGAPKLSAPVALTNVQNQPLLAEGFGLAAPAWYDWNGDGLKDLLIGEFGSGLENGRMVGNFIRVYKNTGTADAPKFSGQWEYALPPAKIHSTGTPYSSNQFCCIGFTPQFVDIDRDGQSDMVTGQYNGEVIWYKGTKDGFLPGEPLQQEGNPLYGDAANVFKDQNYWIFSSASFADLNGDGKPDMVTGGSSLRVSYNIGTEHHPYYTVRDTLRDIEGKALKVYTWSAADIKAHDEAWSNFPASVAAYNQLPAAGDSHVCPLVTDWDNDGVPDILATHIYIGENRNVVDFFKGVKTKSGIRFQRPIALFTAKDGNKAFPGSAPRVFVCDYNGDGVNDLLLGASVPVMHEQWNDELAWKWDVTGGVGHDPGLYEAVAQPNEETKKQMEEFYRRHTPEGFKYEDYKTVKHRGYVYVLLGHK